MRETLVKEGQPLARIETDKAVVEIPAPRDGVILQLKFSEGAVIHVGEVFVVLGEPEEKPAAVSRRNSSHRPAGRGRCSWGFGRGSA